MANSNGGDFVFKIKFFIIAELLLALIGLSSFSYRHDVVPMLIFSVLLIGWGIQRLNRYGKGAILLSLGLINLLIMFLSSPVFWAMILLAMLYFLFMKDGSLQNLFFRDRQGLDFMMLRTTEPQKKSNRQIRYKWLGRNNIGQEAYEWDDINLFMAAGDAVIDLKETLLPKEDSVVNLQIIFGRARIIIPSDIGIHIVHHTLVGDLHFDDDRYMLRNETIDMYSENYDEAFHHLKVITNIGFGEIEVIRV